MKRITLFCLMASLTVVASTARADTIHLKNGSVIKGKVASYADDQFVVVLDTGSSRYLSRAMIFIGDVARIEFDSAPGPEIQSSVPRETSTARETPSGSITSREAERESSSRSTKPREGNREIRLHPPSPNLLLRRESRSENPLKSLKPRQPPPRRLPKFPKSRLQPGSPARSRQSTST